MNLDRREFLERLAALAACGAASACRSETPLPAESGPPPSEGGQAREDAPSPGPPAGTPLFSIALSEWSLRHSLFAGEIDPLDFSVVAREEFDIGEVEYLNQFFLLRVGNHRYLDEMKRRAQDHKVKGVLMRISGAGLLGHPDREECQAAVEKHKPWVEAAARLGCRAVSVSVLSAGTADEQRERTAAGLRPLAEFAAGLGLEVLVENDKGLCTNASWLVSLIREVDHPECRILPDLSVLTGSTEDREEAGNALVRLMPYAGAVRFGRRDFDEQSEAGRTAVEPLLRVMVGSGYRGPVVISCEGGRVDEKGAIRAARRWLAGVREKMTLEQIEMQGSSG